MIRRLQGATIRRRLGDLSDALVASDPGLSRLTLALEVATGIGVTLAAEYGFSQLAHPLWDSAPAGVHLSAAAAMMLSGQHHGVSLIAMLLGGIIGMVSSFAVTDVTRRGQAITMFSMPVPLLATLTISIELAPHRTVALVGLALVMGLGTYLRKFAPRFGPRMVMYGLVLFIGYFFGFLAGKELPIGQIYWVAAILWVAVLVNFVLRLAVFNPLVASAVPRSRRSFAARARGVIAEAAAVLADAENGPASRKQHTPRLARQLVRLNESAIMLDGQLGDPRLGLGLSGAQSHHDALFELELQLENLSRAISALARPDAGLDPALSARVRGWLASVAAGDTSDAAAYGRDGASDDTPGTALATDNVVFATAAIVIAVGESLRRWQRGELPGVETATAFEVPTGYESPVLLIGGNLAGSSPASNAAFAPGAAGGLAARLHLDTVTVAAIRVTIAVGAASAVGSAVNERRFYWAVIAVFIIFMGANTAGEQIIKAIHRVAGTCIGIVLGSLLAHAVGPSTWSIAVVLAAMAFGVYFMRVSYALMAAGITVAVSMLYVDLGEFSNGLLLDRLELTAIGAGIAVLAALVIFPVRTGRVVRQAALQYLEALLAFLDGLSEIAPRASAHGPQAAGSASTAAARHLDDTLQRLLVTARPLVQHPLRREELENNLQVFVLSAHFARNLAGSAGAVTAFGETERAQVGTVLTIEADRVRDLQDTIEQRGTDRQTEAVRASIIPIIEAGRHLAGEGVLRSDPRRQFLTALFNLDSTLQQLREQLAST